MESSLSAESSSSGIIRELRGIRGGGGKTERILAIDMFYGHASPSSSAALLIWQVRKVSQAHKVSQVRKVSGAESDHISVTSVVAARKAINGRDN
jgi:hypothetical protein